MSQQNRDYSEKRDFIRMQVEAGMTIVQGDTRIEATCLDLSSTGMQAKASSHLQVGDRVRIHIPSEHPSLKGLEAEANVVRVTPLADGSQQLGLAFVTLT